MSGYDERGQNVRDPRTLLHDGMPRPSHEENQRVFDGVREKNAVIIGESERLCRILDETGSMILSTTAVCIDPGDPHRERPVMPHTSAYVVIRYTAPDGTACNLTLDRA